MSEYIKYRYNYHGSIENDINKNTTYNKIVCIY